MEQITFEGTNTICAYCQIFQEWLPETTKFQNNHVKTKEGDRSLINNFYCPYVPLFRQTSSKTYFIQKHDIYLSIFNKV